MAYEAWTVEWDMPVIVRDPFRRNSNSSWGEAPGALAYTTGGGAPHEFFVDGSRGRMSIGTLNVLYTADLPINARDIDVTGTVQCDVTPTGAGFELGIRARNTAGSEYVDVRLFPGTGGTVSIAVRQFVGGVETVSGFPTVAGITATTRIAYHLQVIGDVLRARAWDAAADEPTTWAVSLTTTMLLPGAARLFAVAPAGVSNPLPVGVAWDDLLITTPERWVDVTSRVDTAGGPFSITAGDTPEASADTGGFGLPIRNHDQALTPGNTLSQYYPNIAPGSRIRVQETIADRVFHRGFGYVQYPEIAAWTQSSEDSPRDQMITIPVVDRAAWIGQGRTFISTLAEHIIYNGGPALVAYWAMSESEGPDVNPAVGGPWTLTQTTRTIGGGNSSSAAPPAITYGGAGIAPADDLGAIAFEPSLAVDPLTEVDRSFMLAGNRPTPLTLGAGQVLTIVCWARLTQITSIASAPIPIALRSSATSDVDAQITMNGGLISGFSDNVSEWVGSVAGPPLPQDQPIPVGIRIGFAPAVIELWVRGEVYTDTVTVNTATPAVFDRLEIGDTYPGSINHVQIYLGSAADWTHDDFVAQYEMGLQGIERQSTGERIRTVLQYAGVDPSELGRIDDGASLMQVARMAGRNPMDLITETVATEQGEFYIAGDNRPVFADRVRLYNT